MKHLILKELEALLENNYAIENSIELINNSNKNYLKFGDYTTNLPLKLSKKLNKNSIEIGEEIKKIIIESNLNFFEKIDVVMPGFINFFLKKEFVLQEFSKYFDKNYKPKFEHIKKENINYEFVSANPTGFLHIGHARNAVVGDITVRLFEYVGQKVYKEYYINDYGNQINDLANAVRYYYDLELNQAPSILEPLYKGQEIKQFGQILFKEYGDKFKEQSTDNLTKIKSLSLENFLDNIKRTLNRIKIQDFDEYVSEKNLYDSNKVSLIINELKKTNMTYELDNALWLKTTEYGDDKDRVVVKDDGTFTYLAGDIANHVNKIQKGYQKLINLWGKDHHGYEVRVKASLYFLGYKEKLEIDYINMVQISDNGSKLKMSKRAGTSYTINDILNQIEVDVLRYFLVSKSKDQGLEIDISNMNYQSNSNPYFYMQYANARSNQILEKYNQINNHQIDFIENFSFLGKEEHEMVLIKKLLELEEIFTISLNQREPSIIINYLKEISNSFHSFYNYCKVITNNELETKERIFLIQIFRNIMMTIHSILGIEVVNKM